MPRTRLTCKGRDRHCDAKLQVELAAGEGPVEVPCPNCGSTSAARYAVAQTALRNPGRLWHVRTMHAAKHDLYEPLLQPAP